MTEYLEMPPTFIEELGSNVALTKEMRYAHGVSNAQGHRQFYCTMYGGKRYKTTKEQIELATIKYEENKKAAIESIGNKLVFVGMGCNYSPRYDDDVCNHRIRTEIINSKGNKYFAEFGTWGKEKMRYDHLVDRDLENTYENERKNLRKQIEEKGGFNKIYFNDPLMIELRKFEQQPFYWYKEKYARPLIDAGIKYTNQNVIKFVNDIFDCHFTEMVVDYYHLKTDDYFSISPKK